MKRKFVSLAVTLFLTLMITKADAQYFCFWVANHSGETFSELKIRASNSGDAFSKDLLPTDLIENGKHFWVKTGTDEIETWDVQITNLDGSPLLFTYQDVNGNWHKGQKYVTVNAKKLHTLAIENTADGGLTFKYYEVDALGFGDPCSN
jgi:hypothetical protein